MTAVIWKFPTWSKNGQETPPICSIFLLQGWARESSELVNLLVAEETSAKSSRELRVAAEELKTSYHNREMLPQIIGFLNHRSLI